MPTSIRLAPDVEQRLDALAKQTGRSKAYYLRELIESGLSGMEDRYLAEKRLTDGKPLVRVVPDEP
jgi:RHH-type rel operon transcriptional repressor/antitoxin RelB